MSTSQEFGVCPSVRDLTKFRCDSPYLIYITIPWMITFSSCCWNVRATIKCTLSLSFIFCIGTFSLCNYLSSCNVHGITAIWALCSQAITWHILHKIMGYSLTNARNGKQHVENLKMAKFEAPIIKGSQSRYFELFWPSTKLPLRWRKPENNSFLRRGSTWKPYFSWVLAFNANISFTFQAIKNLYVHFTYLCFMPLCKFWGDF